MLSIGELAPDFSLPAINFDGSLNTFILSQYRGRNVILYFYPKDNTSGCTQQACDFREEFSFFSNRETVIVGISKDSLKSHMGFKSKHELPFVLASDEQGEVCAAYGTWVEKSMYGKKYFGIERATFLVDPQGRLTHVWRRVKVKGHIEQIKGCLKSRG